MKHLVSFTFHSVVLFVTLSGMLLGCSKAKNSWETAYPAQGIITYEGKPLEGAQIILVPESKDFPNSIRPSATSRAGGAFVLTTHARNDGAPAGDYKVTVVHFPAVGPPESPSPGPNDLPAKYAKPDTTDLKLVVTAPKTEFPPLDLKKK